MPRDSEGLNPRQSRFVAEYVKDFNGTQALVRAGYSPNGANRQVSAILSNPVIARAIGRRRADFMAKLESEGLASLREIQIDLTTQLRGTQYQQDIADLTADLAPLKEAHASLGRDLRRRGLDPNTRVQVTGRLLEMDRRIFKRKLALAHLHLAQDRMARRASALLAKLFGAFDPWRPPAKNINETADRMMYSLRRAGVDPREVLGGKARPE